MRETKRNVGFDGESYFCMRCGRSGFASEAAAVGHLAQCSGRPVPGGAGRLIPAGGAGGGAGGGAERVALAEINQRLDRLERYLTNHVAHLSSVQEWEDKRLMVGVLVILLFFWWVSTRPESASSRLAERVGERVVAKALERIF